MALKIVSGCGDEELPKNTARMKPLDFVQIMLMALLRLEARLHDWRAFTATEQVTVDSGVTTVARVWWKANRNTYSKPTTQDQMFA